jgi:hypothetical protein
LEKVIKQPLEFVKDPDRKGIFINKSGNNFKGLFGYNVFQMRVNLFYVADKIV